MQTGNVTTPFGRRPVTLALVRRQQAAAEIKAGKSVEKWKVFRDVSAALPLLPIQSNSLAVLDALLSFYPESTLRQEASLIVFPSNAQLSLRAHGMAESTLRRHLVLLVDAGLIVRRDSANGKRFVRRDRTGEVENAFGFDLSPLLARAEELAMLAQQIAEERAVLRRRKEDLTICRRDVRKLITAAMEDGAEGNWQELEGAYISLVNRLPRKPTLSELKELLADMHILREKTLNRLERCQNTQNLSGNAVQIERHIQNSKPESFHELEPRNESAAGQTLTLPRQAKPAATSVFPLGLVLKACPQIMDYGPAGAIPSWRELFSAAVTVRSMLGISPSAYQEACEVMGPENAAIAVAGILERAHMINSPGGYLRDLTRRAERGEFSLGPMLMALLKTNTEPQSRAG